MRLAALAAAAAAAHAAARCGMTYMRPDFRTLPLLAANGSAEHHHSLERYVEQGVEAPPAGAPCVMIVLYVPGSAGAHTQARAIASTLLRAPRAARRVHVYALRHGGGHSAFDGRVLQAHARLVSRAMATLCAAYAPSACPPVAILGHSMGAIAALEALRMRAVALGGGPGADAAEPSPTWPTAAALGGLGAPFRRAPAALSPSLDAVYTQLRAHWASDATWAGGDGLLPAFASVSSTTDFQVPAEMAGLDGVVPERAIAVDSPAQRLDGVWADPDHLSLLWCAQLVRPVAAGLLALADALPSTGTPAAPLRARVEALRRGFGARRADLAPAESAELAARMCDMDDGLEIVGAGPVHRLGLGRTLAWHDPAPSAADEGRGEFVAAATGCARLAVAVCPAAPGAEPSLVQSVHVADPTDDGEVQFVHVDGSMLAGAARLAARLFAAPWAQLRAAHRPAAMLPLRCALPLWGALCALGFTPGPAAAPAGGALLTDVRVAPSLDWGAPRHVDATGAAGVGGSPDGIDDGDAPLQLALWIAAAPAPGGVDDGDDARGDASLRALLHLGTRELCGLGTFVSKSAEDAALLWVDVGAGDCAFTWQLLDTQQRLHVEAAPVWLPTLGRFVRRRGAAVLCDGARLLMLATAGRLAWQAAATASVCGRAGALGAATIGAMIGAYLPRADGGCASYVVALHAALRLIAAIAVGGVMVGLGAAARAARWCLLRLRAGDGGVGGALVFALVTIAASVGYHPYAGAVLAAVGAPGVTPASFAAGASLALSFGHVAYVHELVLERPTRVETHTDAALGAAAVLLMPLLYAVGALWRARRRRHEPRARSRRPRPVVRTLAAAAALAAAAWPEWAAAIGGVLGAWYHASDVAVAPDSAHAAAWLCAAGHALALLA